MAKERSVRTGAIPYDDNSGFRYRLEIDESYIWVDGGSLMIDTDDWVSFREAVEAGLAAFSHIRLEQTPKPETPPEK